MKLDQLILRVFWPGLFNFLVHCACTKQKYPNFLRNCFWKFIFYTITFFQVPFSSFKLSTLKVDTKYTTTTQIVKLSTSHSISKISLRIGDLKRQKMVRTINIYYNNRSVQAVVELKNRPTMWHKARSVSLTAGQTEIKIEFPLPIVACNLMIEYADFYENIQASSETLQCPRCSASVPGLKEIILFSNSLFRFINKS